MMRKTGGRDTLLNRNKEACHCHTVTYGQIMDAVAGGAATFSQVQALTHCSTGCGKCREFIEILIRDLVEDRKEDPQ